MSFIQGVNQSFLFPALMQWMEENKRRNVRQQALDEFQQSRTITETIPTPPIQAPAQAGGGYNPMTGTGARLNIPEMSIAQPSTQEQRQIGLDDPRALPLLMKYYSDVGEPLGLNNVLAQIQAGQSKFQEVPAGTTYGSVKGGVFTPQGTTAPRTTLSDVSTDWQVEYDASGKPALEKIPGTTATRVKKFKWQTNPITKQLEKIYDLEAGGTQPDPNRTTFDERQERFYTNLQAREREKFNSNPNVQKWTQQRAATSEVRDYVRVARENPTNEVAVGQLEYALAKIRDSGGRLSDQDVERATGVVSWGKKLQNFLSKGVAGRPTKEVLSDFEEITDIMEKTSNHNLNRQAVEGARGLSNVTKGWIAPQDAYDYLNPYSNETFDAVNNRLGGKVSSKIPEIKSDEDYDKLPSGSEFIAPDGTRRKKP